MILVGDKQEVSMGELINPCFDFILAYIYLTFFPFILMLNLDEKESNLLPWVYFVLIDWFSLFLGVDAKTLRKSRVLIEKEAFGMSLKRKKKFYKVQGRQKASMKSLKECTASA